MKRDGLHFGQSGYCAEIVYKIAFELMVDLDEDALRVWMRSLAGAYPTVNFDIKRASAYRYHICFAGHCDPKVAAENFGKMLYKIEAEVLAAERVEQLLGMRHREPEQGAEVGAERDQN